jgi:hypothetical protein
MWRFFIGFSNGAMTQAASRRPFITEAGDQSSVSPYSICGGRSVRHFSFLALMFSTVALIPSTHHAHISLIYYALCLILAIDGVLKLSASRRQFLVASSGT